MLDTPSFQESQAVDDSSGRSRLPNPDYHYFQIYGNIGGDCTNFVSQCLFAGGIEQVIDSVAPWWYKDKNNWAIAWINAHSLYWCLKIRDRQKLTGPRGSEVDSVDELELGDLIFYENINGGIDHVGIITGFRYGLPTITQHSPELVNISYLKTNKSKMYFMKISS